MGPGPDDGAVDSAIGNDVVGRFEGVKQLISIPIAAPKTATDSALFGLCPTLDTLVTNSRVFRILRLEFGDNPRAKNATALDRALLANADCQCD